MESSLKSWLIRILFIVPVLCLIISVVLWKHGQNEKFDIQTVRRELKDLQNQIDADNMKREVQNDKVKRQSQDDRIFQITSSTGGGAVFVHWGRKNCSCTTDLVYSGMAGGGHYLHTGSAVNMLCMTLNPVWARYGNAGVYTYLYGTEYEVVPNDFPLGHDRARTLHDHNVPCSVCRSATRTSVIMIPGTTRCTTGWTAEYSGYLMAGRNFHAAGTEYNCIDANPDAHESGVVDDNGHLLYRVKAKCGSLPCGPYVDMREITCVVCTK